MFLLLVLLALVQGLTEFLPISSSGHLVLIWQSGLAQEQDFSQQAELVLDVAVHMGTLFAVIIYFWRDVWSMTKGAHALTRREPDANSQLFLAVVVGSIPLIVAGFLLKDIVALYLRTPAVIAYASIVFGIVLWVADRYMMQIRKSENLDWPEIITIGLAQVLALIPGTSRSGITMAAGRAHGMERQEAARFSMLLAIPAIAGAGTLASIDLITAKNAALTSSALVAGGLAFVFALLAIHWLMRWLRRASFTIFVVYRILMGLLILAIITF